MTDIRYDLRDYRDLYAKLRRDVARFHEDPNGDHLFNAMVTAWCLADWLVADLPNPSEAKYPGLRALASRTTSTESRRHEQLARVMRICADVADGSKHGRLDRPSRIVSRVARWNGDGTFGDSVFGNHTFGDSRVSYDVVVGDEVHDAEDILAKVMALYDEFLTKHKLLDQALGEDQD